MTFCTTVSTELGTRGNKSFESCYQAIKNMCDPDPEDGDDPQVDPDSFTPDVHSAKNTVCKSELKSSAISSQTGTRTPKKI
jgi:hypothetical protein